MEEKTKPKPYLLWLDDDEIKQMEPLLAVLRVLIEDHHHQLGQNNLRFVNRYKRLESLITKVDRLSFQYEDSNSLFYYRQRILMYHDALRDLLLEFRKKHQGLDAKSTSVHQLMSWCNNYRQGSKQSQNNSRRTTNGSMITGE